MTEYLESLIRHTIAMLEFDKTKTDEVKEYLYRNLVELYDSLKDVYRKKS